jgi:hypothetical protein
MSSLVIAGDISGTVTLDAPATAGSTVLTLPATSGTILTTGGGAAGSFTSLTNSGNLTFTGTGNRITGDFSNATVASRVAIQTSTTNGVTGLIVLPNGTSVNSNIALFNNSDPSNASFIGMSTAIGSDARIQSGQVGSGTFLPMTFLTGGSERMRIDTSGNVLVGATDNNIGGGGAGFKFIASSTIPNVGQVINTAGAYNTYHLYNTNATNNGYRFYVSANGGINNFSGNNVNLSDERTKANIELSGNYLEKICAIPVKLFNYKDEPEGEQRTLGVIAQDVEAVAPEFVNTDGWKGKEPVNSVPMKSIYTIDMMFALMKSIQELNAKVEALEAQLNKE